MEKFIIFPIFFSIFSIKKIFIMKQLISKRNLALVQAYCKQEGINSTKVEFTLDKDKNTRARITDRSGMIHSYPNNDLEAI